MKFFQFIVHSNKSAICATKNSKKQAGTWNRNIAPPNRNFVAPRDDLRAEERFARRVRFFKWLRQINEDVRGTMKKYPLMPGSLEIQPQMIKNENEYKFMVEIELGFLCRTINKKISQILPSGTPHAEKIKLPELFVGYENKGAEMAFVNKGKLIKSKKGKIEVKI